MFKSRIPSWCDPVAFRRCLARLLAVIGMLVLVAALPLRASDTDDRYFQIYGVIEQADALHKAGQVEKAKAKYLEADKALKGLRQHHPNYNSKLVAARLTYLAEKISLLSRPPAPAIPTNETASVASATSASVPGQPRIKLLEAGAEPRQALRLKAQADATQKVKVVVKMKMGLVAPEMPSEMMAMPAMNLAATLTIRGVSPEGDVAFEIKIDEADVAKDGGAPAEVAEEMKKQFGPMKGLVLAGTMTELYFTKKIEAKIPPGTSAEVRESMKEMGKAFANTEFILPAEAIGVGAKWEVKQKTKEQGMTIDETIQHELVSLDGDVAVVKSTTTQSAANQKISNPIMPAVKVDMIKLTGTATENATISLTKLLPVKSTSDDHSEMLMAMNTGGTKQSLTMKSETHSTLETE